VVVSDTFKKNARVKVFLVTFVIIQLEKKNIQHGNKTNQNFKCSMFLLCQSCKVEKMMVMPLVTVYVSFDFIVNRQKHLWGHEHEWCMIAWVIMHQFMSNTFGTKTDTIWKLCTPHTMRVHAMVVRLQTPVSRLLTIFGTVRNASLYIENISNTKKISVFFCWNNGQHAVRLLCTRFNFYATTMTIFCSYFSISILQQSRLLQ
jgi:hypothetical protein